MVERQIVDFEDYKNCLKFLLERPGSGPKAGLARAMGCQPAYLSRVLNGDGELSLEQMDAACRHFVLGPSESAYMIALVGENRASTSHLKSYWRKQMAEQREQFTHLHGRMDLEDSLSEKDTLTYYGSWHYTAIHMATSIPSLQTVPAICNYLSLPESVVRGALDFLIKTGLVDNRKGAFVISDRNIHLDRHRMMTNKHHANWKMKSIETLNAPESNAIHYTGIVSLSPEDAKTLKNIILRSVQKVREVVRDSSEEILGCYSFEFFEIGNSRKAKP
jgi:uncharacterized protein (TIGR02147 family)